MLCVIKLLILIYKGLKYRILKQNCYTASEHIYSDSLLVWWDVIPRTPDMRQGCEHAQGDVFCLNDMPWVVNYLLSLAHQCN